MSRLTQSPGLALRLEQGQDVSLADRALDVADDAAVRVVEELDAHLRDLTTRASAAKDLCDAGLLDGRFLLGAREGERQREGEQRGREQERERERGEIQHSAG